MLKAIKENQHWLVFGVVTVIGTVLDIWTKVWAFEWSNMRYDGKPHLYEKADAAGELVAAIEVIPGWFDFRLAMNEGAAFSMFSGQINFFMVITVAATLFLFYMVQTAPRQKMTLPLLLGLVFSGVLGNFWDRVVFGGVRDFIHWHTPPEGFLFFSRYDYPTFNVADIWICVGAIALALYYWREDRIAALEAASTESATKTESAQPALTEPAKESTETAAEGATENATTAEHSESGKSESNNSDNAPAKANPNQKKNKKKKRKKKRR